MKSGNDDTWRLYGYDAWCPPCLVALIEQASVVQRILGHLGLPTAVPAARPARWPPGRLETLEDQSRESRARRAW